MAPRETLLKEYKPSALLVSQVSLHFALDEHDTLVKSVLKCSRNPALPPSEPLLLHRGEDLKLDGRILLNGAELADSDYTLDDDKLVILKAPTEGDFELRINTRINPSTNKSCEGLYVSDSLLCTQCEAEGFRRMTFFPDRPDVLAEYRVRLEADKEKYPILLSNGNIVGSGDLEGGKHYAEFHDPFLKPTYLFALVAGKLNLLEDSYTRANGKPVTIRMWAEGDVSKCQHALDSLKRAFKWDEETYGRIYDLDVLHIVAMRVFQAGAMEGKGLKTFSLKYILASQETATDTDFNNVEGVIAHEYFHNWSGNRVTCRDWFQLSLKEGFTVFRDQSFSADMAEGDAKRINDVALLRSYQFPEDAGPMAHPVQPKSYEEINNFYTATVYEKGAEVVRMYRTLLGKETFRKGTDIYFDRHDGQAVTINEFRKAMEDASGEDLSQFSRWYDFAGTPVVTVLASEYDQAAKKYTVKLRQSCPPTPECPAGQEKPPFLIPVAVGLLGPDGKDIPLNGKGDTTVVLRFTDREQTFELSDISSEPRVCSLLRGFSAPVKISYSPESLRPSQEQLAFQMAHDSDVFNRWDAAQNLGLSILLDLSKRIAAGADLSKETLPPVFVDAFQKALRHPDARKLVGVAVLSLPSEKYMIEQLEDGTIDPIAVHNARDFVMRSLAASLQADFEDIYAQCTNEAPKTFSVDPQSQGLRALRNLALRYLASLQTEKVNEMCLAQLRSANNMTDSMGALMSLSSTPLESPARKTAMEEFYAKWKGDYLVANKWLSAQAMAQVDGALQEVVRLSEHPGFDFESPHTVYALVGAFASGNTLNFHAMDGSGYRFLVDQILKVDKYNSACASRIFDPLTQWKRYDPVHQKLMKAEIERLSSHKLGADVREKVDKTLKQ